MVVCSPDPPVSPRSFFLQITAPRLSPLLVSLLRLLVVVCPPSPLNPRPSQAASCHNRLEFSNVPTVTPPSATVEPVSPSLETIEIDLGDEPDFHFDRKDKTTFR
jgi:hypothetical protein